VKPEQAQALARAHQEVRSLELAARIQARHQEVEAPFLLQADLDTARKRLERLREMTGLQPAPISVADQLREIAEITPCEGWSLWDDEIGDPFGDVLRAFNYAATGDAYWLTARPADQMNYILLCAEALDNF
jgi:hypothetical protein